MNAEDLLVMSINVSADASADNSASTDAGESARYAALEKRDRAVLALVEEIGIHAILDSLAGCAEEGAEVHEHEQEAETRAAVRELRSFAQSIRNARKSVSA